MKEEELKEIRERANKATSGPWKVFYDSDEYPDSITPIVGNSYGSDIIKFYEITESEDAEFIAHAREDVPKLLDEIERLREALEWYAYSGHYVPVYENVIWQSEASIDAGHRARQVLGESS